jgi:hypothetical protein
MRSPRECLVSVAIVGLAVQAVVVTASHAQVAHDAHHGQAAAGESALVRHHGEVVKLLNTAEAAHVELYERLLSEPDIAPERLEGELFESWLAAARAAAIGEGSLDVPAAPNLTRVVPRLKETMEWAYALQRTIYEVYSDETIENKRAAVDEAVDRYLARSDVALSPAPKSMEVMEEQHGTLVFRERYPQTAGLFWALRWLQMGASEPLIVYHGIDEQHAAVENTMDRFTEMLSDPPENFPWHMPMAPTIAPELVTRNARAAAILDNLNMLHDVVVDILVNERVTDRGGAIDDALRIFSDPSYLAIAEIDWIRMALRHGIYAQGGPAIGRIDRPERNDGGHQHHGEGGGTTRHRPPGM